MKQIFRNLKNDNKNKAMTHMIYVETQCGKKSRTTMSTINPLYEQGEYKTITITTVIRSNSRITISLVISFKISLPLNVFRDLRMVLDPR